MKISEIGQLGVRLQPELKDWLRKEAKQNQRTMNSEIVFIIENEKARRASTQQALNESSTNEI